MTEKPVKVFLWSQLRSLSTAFFRAMSNHPNCHVIFEPYSLCFYFGTDRRSSRYKDAPNPEISYQKAQDNMELPFADKDFVFVKDMGYTLQGRLNDSSVLPKGYKHTFLIRDPRKQILSLHSVIKKQAARGWDYFEPSEIGADNLWEVYEIVTKTLKQDTIIIDADDLLSDPEGILCKYCDHVGIEYCDEMVNWRADHGLKEMLDDWGDAWFGTLLATTRFEARPATSHTIEDVTSDLPAEMLQAIEHAMPFYLKLHEKRTTVGSIAEKC